MKKKLHNQKRGGRRRESEDEHSKEARRAEHDGIELDLAVIAYVRLAVSLIEGRRVSREEIVEILRRAMRQRSLARERRVDYVVRTLREDPP